MPSTPKVQRYNVSKFLDVGVQAGGAEAETAEYLARRDQEYRRAMRIRSEDPLADDRIAAAVAWPAGYDDDDDGVGAAAVPLEPPLNANPLALRRVAETPPPPTTSWQTSSMPMAGEVSGRAAAARAQAFALLRGVQPGQGVWLERQQCAGTVVANNPFFRQLHVRINDGPPSAAPPAAGVAPVVAGAIVEVAYEELPRVEPSREPATERTPHSDYDYSPRPPPRAYDDWSSKPLSEGLAASAALQSEWRLRLHRGDRDWSGAASAEPSLTATARDETLAPALSELSLNEGIAQLERKVRELAAVAPPLLGGRPRPGSRSSNGSSAASSPRPAAARRRSSRPRRPRHLAVASRSPSPTPRDAASPTATRRRPKSAAKKPAVLKDESGAHPYFA